MLGIGVFSFDERYEQGKCRVQYESVPQAVSQVLLFLRNPKLVRYGETPILMCGRQRQHTAGNSPDSSKGMA